MRKEKLTQALNCSRISELNTGALTIKLIVNAPVFSSDIQLQFSAWVSFSFLMYFPWRCFKFHRQVVMFNSYICHILDPVVGSCLKPKARCHGWVLMLGFLEYGTECWMLPLITQTGIYNKNIKLPSDVVNNLFEVFFWLFFNSRG